MRTWAKGSAPAALLAVAAMSLGGGTAVADTSGDSSAVGGNQINVPISLPIDISGNAVGVLGNAEAGSTGGSTVQNTGPRGGITGSTSGDSSAVGGNQVNVPVSAPVNACGNAISLIGNSDAGCRGGSTVTSSGGNGTGGNTTSGRSGAVAGNQVLAPITTPLDVCGNALAIFGNATAGCRGGAAVRQSAAGPATGGNATSGRSGAVSGNQLVAPVSAPIDVCGNTTALVGNAFAGCTGGAGVTDTAPGRGFQSRRAPGSTGNDTDGRFGAGSGNQVIAPVALPVAACGNAVGNASANCTGGSTVETSRSGTGAGNNIASGQSGAVSGNQLVAPVSAPIDVCGNAVALVGDAFAGCTGGATVRNGGHGAGGNWTSGTSGAVSGNQVVAPITAPLDVCGNAAALVGNSEAGCRGGASVPQGQGGGAGGNSTSGQSGAVSGNQVTAPITAPLSVCGNTAAVLGDAAAGCLGGAHTGKPKPKYGAAQDHWSRGAGRVKKHTSGTLPVAPGLPGPEQVGALTQGLPALPVVGDATGGLTKGLPALPVVGDATGTLGLPEVPGLPNAASKGPAPAAKRPWPGATKPRPAGAPKTRPAGAAKPRPADPAKPMPGGLPGSLPVDPTKALPLPKGLVPADVTGLVPAQVTGMVPADVSRLVPAGLPVVSDVAALPEVPGLPGLPAAPARPAVKATAVKSTKTFTSKAAPKPPEVGGLTGPLSPATDLIGSTPIGQAVGQTTASLPLGLMSAEQPAGVKGMNSGSLFALLLGGMFAVSSMLFAATRRFRPNR
ncbi:hypothetical protein Misp01_82940 [Microtetraspora sp. NBRC 13810]|uniref:chaplin family protein n=1 Tax=Microtetraspora sp. NBRC 13810 TaxID=3030990 RepID=UPI0024A0DBDA|nr:chaplin family protein [Microtetraspora sp. NBRC 13810]GLW13166.1 hypothetical protein Misp01_82940 [Microtetraspora sp. NBRC 13810]